MMDELFSSNCPLLMISADNEFQGWNFDMGNLRWSERRVYIQEMKCLHVHQLSE